MKSVAAVARALKAPFTIESIDLPEPQDDEVLVKVVSAGICHADISCKDGIIPSPFPILLGHEGAGVVEKVGKRVTKLAPGDHVVMCVDACGTCPECLKGEPAYCFNVLPLNFCTQAERNRKAAGADGSSIILKYFGQSSFAQYALSYERNSIKVRKDIPLRILGPLGCGINTGAGTVMNGLNAKPGSSLVVLGAGSVGLSSVMGAKLCHCGTIVAVDVLGTRLDMAMALGATHTIDGKKEPDVAKAIRAIVPAGVDYILDTAGVSRLLTQAATALGVRGTLALVGVMSGGNNLEVPHFQLLAQGNVIQGFMQGHGVPQLFIPQLIDLYAKGLFPFDKMLTFYPLEKINQAVDDQLAGKVVKPVLEF